GGGHVAVAGGVVAHRRGQAALVLQPVVAVARQLRHGMAREELRVGAAPGGLGGHRLGAVLAELEGRGVVAVRPRAAGAVEAVWLVHRKQGARTLHGNALFREVAGDGLPRVPAAGGAVVFTQGAFFAHGGDVATDAPARRQGWV